MIYFCKRALQERQYSAKQNCNFIDPTDRRHTIPTSVPHVFIIRMSRVTYEWVMDMRHDSFICVTWLMHMCRPWRLWIYSQLVACSCVGCVVRVCAVTWLIYMCDMTHSYVTWLIYMWRDSCTCDRPWRQWICSRLTASLLCDMSHSYVTSLRYGLFYKRAL